MSFFDKFKQLLKLKRPVKPKKPVKKIKKPEKPIPRPVKIPKVKKKVVAEASKIILAPQVTEKTTDLVAENKYVFRVAKIANKSQIKQAIEALYGVKVVGVNIINIHRRLRRVGRTTGFKPGYKKAIVTLVPGQKIEVVKGV